jgi:hypothetical protein
MIWVLMFIIISGMFFWLDWEYEKHKENIKKTYRHHAFIK